MSCDEDSAVSTKHAVSRSNPTHQKKQCARRNSAAALERKHQRKAKGLGRSRVFDYCTSPPARISTTSRNNFELHDSFVHRRSPATHGTARFVLDRTRRALRVFERRPVRVCNRVESRDILANRLVGLTGSLGPGEEQFAVSTGTQLIDSRVPLVLVGRRPGRVLLLLLLPRWMSLGRIRGFQALHDHRLRVQPDGTVHALQLQIGQTGGRDLVRPGLDHHPLRRADLQ